MPCPITISRFYMYIIMCCRKLLGVVDLTLHTSNIMIFLTVPNFSHSWRRSSLISFRTVGSSFWFTKSSITLQALVNTHAYTSLTSNSLGSKRCLKTIILSFFILFGTSVLLSRQSSSLVDGEREIIFIHTKDYWYLHGYRCMFLEYAMALSFKIGLTFLVHLSFFPSSSSSWDWDCSLLSVQSGPEYQSTRVKTKAYRWDGWPT